MAKRLQAERLDVPGMDYAPKNEQGEAMEFLCFEDETAVYETTFFPKAYQRFRYVLDWGRPYLIGGKVEEDFGVVTLTVDRVEQLEYQTGLVPSAVQ